MSLTKTVIIISALFILLILAGCPARQQTPPPGETQAGNTGSQTPLPPVQLLNVSYDPTRELYEEYNQAFAAHWKTEHNQEITVRQSHAGSGSQARSVADGLQADVVTLALAYDIDSIAQAGLIAPDWQSRLQHNSSPYTSTIVFVVRSGNPKGIHDWGDLIKEGVSIITPNPKTSGGARWNFLAAWAYAIEQNNNDEAAATEFVTKLYRNAPVLDSGARGSTTTFVERQMGDVLLAWENEAYLIIKEFGSDKYEIVNPSISILAEPPVTIVDTFVDKRGTRDIATAYLEYLYSEEGQNIIAKHFYRPTMESVLAQYADKFAQIEMVTINDMFGGWAAAQAKFFADGGIFDQIYLSQQ